MRPSSQGELRYQNPILLTKTCGLLPYTIRAPALTPRPTIDEALEHDLFDRNKQFCTNRCLSGKSHGRTKGQCESIMCPRVKVKIFNFKRMRCSSGNRVALQHQHFVFIACEQSSATEPTDSALDEDHINFFYTYKQHVLNFGDPTELTPSTPRNLCGAETIPDTSYFTDLQAFLKLEQDYICIFAISSIDIKLLT
ncbi:hypothetical protein MPTK1_5g09110 [Marchantia polymorpha subsp. ruderalis]|uniref:Uncharacterized protein n=2 Tax=Marchantia polymorpha TaxID=3197 RepID=A0AAF6BGH3_MARPO|nr:hypothetical protein MARPO_0095s0048 [Marchantia polymorpha]BBN11107.1 hypothetical protein Mp_5g09110 [Marchantia polymorpha subsp. ruderalis]|eukprot:PTQ32790.1 hypothetical protein MARPO_0095s0048 [Marchantia polymorpha]